MSTFYLWYLKYILMLKPLCFYLNQILNAGRLVFLLCRIATFTHVKDLNSSSTSVGSQGLVL